MLEGMSGRGGAPFEGRHLSREGCAQGRGRGSSQPMGKVRASGIAGDQQTVEVAAA